MEEIFEKNLELWARKEPKEALLMPYLSEGDIVHCKTEENEDNLCRKRASGDEYLHSQQGAVKEALEWFSQLDLSDVDLVYIYGIGLGYYYDAILVWLRSNAERTAVFLEDDLHVIAEFLKTERAHQLLQDSQVHLVYLKEGSSKKDLLGEQYWNYALTKAAVTGLNVYKKTKGEAYQEIAHEISYSSDLKKALLDEYLNFGAAYFVNYYQNLLQLPNSYLGDKLFGKFSRIPAIICGAGPSLEKNAPMLRQLAQRGLIFAGGSSINILNAMGIQPHFCAGIDPNDAQQVRLRSNQAFEVPFFYRQRLNYGAFCSVHGPRLYVTGSGGYDVARFFEQKLGIEGEFFEEGHNVINFAMELAYQMGCDPIIFVGMDLAFTDNKTYSPGVTFDPSVEQRTLDEYANFEKSGMLRKDIFGNPIYTLWKWVAEAEWIGSWAEAHPECRLINCTEGGLGFPSVPNQALAETAYSTLREMRDFPGWIHAELQNSQMPNVTQEKVEAAMFALRDSLKRCCDDFDILIEDTDLLIKKISAEKKTVAHAQSGLAALTEYELAEEPAYSAILEIFNTVASRLLNKDLIKIRYNDAYAEDWQKHCLRLELNKKKMGFLQNVAQVNAGLIDYAFEEREKASATSQPTSLETLKINPSVTPEGKDLFFSDNYSSQEAPWRIYYESGALKGESHYQKGLLNGFSQFYAESGALLSRANYVEGKLEGELLQYFPSGSRYSEQKFLNGQAEGFQRYYYANGQLKTELEYAKGQLTGKVTLYHADGTLKRQIMVD